MIDGYQVVFVFVAMLSWVFACVTVLVQQLTISKLKRMIRTQQQAMSTQQITIELQNGSIARQDQMLKDFKNFLDGQMAVLIDKLKK